MRNIIKKSITWLLIFAVAFTPVLTGLDLKIANAEEGIIPIVISDEINGLTIPEDNLTDTTKAAVDISAQVGTAGVDAGDAATEAENYANGITTDAQGIQDAVANAQSSADEVAALNKAAGDASTYINGTQYYFYHKDGEGEKLVDAAAKAEKDAKDAVKAANKLVNDANKELAAAEKAKGEAEKALEDAKGKIEKAEDEVGDVDPLKTQADTDTQAANKAKSDADTATKEALDAIENTLNAALDTNSETETTNLQDAVKATEEASTEALRIAGEQMTVAEEALRLAQSYAAESGAHLEDYGQWQMIEVVRGAQGAAENANRAVTAAQQAVTAAEQQEELADAALTAAKTALEEAKTAMLTELEKYKTAIAEINADELATANASRKEVRDAMKEANDAIDAAEKALNGNMFTGADNKVYSADALAALANAAFDKAQKALNNLGAKDTGKGYLGKAQTAITNAKTGVDGQLEDLNKAKKAYDDAIAAQNEAGKVVGSAKDNAKAAAELAADIETKVNKGYITLFEGWAERTDTDMNEIKALLNKGVSYNDLLAAVIEAQSNLDSMDKKPSEQDVADYDQAVLDEDVKNRAVTDAEGAVETKNTEISGYITRKGQLEETLRGLNTSIESYEQNFSDYTESDATALKDLIEALKKRYQYVEADDKITFKNITTGEEGFFDSDEYTKLVADSNKRDTNQYKKGDDVLKDTDQTYSVSDEKAKYKKTNNTVPANTEVTVPAGAKNVQTGKESDYVWDEDNQCLKKTQTTTWEMETLTKDASHQIKNNKYSNGEYKGSYYYEGYNAGEQPRIDEVHDDYKQTIEENLRTLNKLNNKGDRLSFDWENNIVYIHNGNSSNIKAKYYFEIVKEEYEAPQLRGWYYDAKWYLTTTFKYYEVSSTTTFGSGTATKYYSADKYVLEPAEITTKEKNKAIEDLAKITANETTQSDYSANLAKKALHDTADTELNKDGGLYAQKKVTEEELYGKKNDKNVVIEEGIDQKLEKARNELGTETDDKDANTLYGKLKKAQAEKDANDDKLELKDQVEAFRRLTGLLTDAQTALDDGQKIPEGFEDYAILVDSKDKELIDKLIEEYEDFLYKNGMSDKHELYSKVIQFFTLGFFGHYTEWVSEVEADQANDKCMFVCTDVNLISYLRTQLAQKRVDDAKAAADEALANLEGAKETLNSLKKNEEKARRAYFGAKISLENAQDTLLQLQNKLDKLSVNGLNDKVSTKEINRLLNKYERELNALKKYSKNDINKYAALNFNTNKFKEFNFDDPKAKINKKQLNNQLVEAIKAAQKIVEDEEEKLNKAKENTTNAKLKLEDIRRLAGEAEAQALIAANNFNKLPPDIIPGGGGESGAAIATTPAAVIPFTLPTAGAAATGVAGVRRNRTTAAAGAADGKVEKKKETSGPKLVALEDEEEEEEKIDEKKTTTIEEEDLAAAKAPESSESGFMWWWWLLITAAALIVGYTGYKIYDKKQNEDKIDR